MLNNIINDIKYAIKTLIEENISPLPEITTSCVSMAPSAKLPSVTTGDSVKSPQIMPQIQITLVSDIPDLRKGQSYNYRVFYKEPNTNIPGVNVTVYDEAGNEHTGAYYCEMYVQPQRYVFRFRLNILAEREVECESAYAQLQTLFEGQRSNRLKVTRNTDDEAECVEYFEYVTLGGKHFPFDGELAKSVIELDIFAYHDTNFAPVKVFKIQKINKLFYSE